MLRKMYRVKEVAKSLGYRCQPFGRWCARAHFPAPVKLTPAITAWPEDVLEEWQHVGSRDASGAKSMPRLDEFIDGQVSLPVRA
jgi:predicted DNA-binding transcriptional regulator AlpA